MTGPSCARVPGRTNTSPGYVSVHRSKGRNLNGNIVLQAIAGHIVHRHLTVSIKNSGYFADGCFNTVFASRDPSHEMKSSDQANGPVPTHPQIADIIEVDHARSAR